ncbi:hypothetical protein ACHAWT_010012 [Skeletonema menzelii]
MLKKFDQCLFHLHLFHLRYGKLCKHQNTSTQGPLRQMCRVERIQTILVYSFASVASQARAVTVSVACFASKKATTEQVYANFCFCSLSLNQAKSCLFSTQRFVAECMLLDSSTGKAGHYKSYVQFTTTI